jgi:hypothetical protein
VAYFLSERPQNVMAVTEPPSRFWQGCPRGETIMLWEKVGRLYDYVEAALWATLLAFVLYFTVFIIPKLPEIRSRNERVRVQEIAAENELYCAKLGMKLGTENHNRCLLDLGEFRMNVEKRMRDESGSF